MYGFKRTGKNQQPHLNLIVNINLYINLIMNLNINLHIKLNINLNLNLNINIRNFQKTRRFDGIFESVLEKIFGPPPTPINFVHDFSQIIIFYLLLFQGQVRLKQVLGKTGWGAKCPGQDRLGGCALRPHDQR